MTADEFRNVYQRLPVAFLLATSDGIVEAVNFSCTELLETPERTLSGAAVENLVADDPRKVRRYLQLWSGSRDFLPGALQFRVGGRELDLRVNGATAGKGSSRVLLHLAPRTESHRGFVALNEKIEELAAEIEERRRTEALIRDQNEALGMIARDEPLSHIFRRLTMMLCGPNSSEMRASILVARENGRVRTAGGTGLPPDWNQALEEMISGNPGFIGREPAVWRDIATDPEWSRVHEMTRRHALRSCWCFPVFSGRAELLGAAMVFSKTSAEPTERQWRLSSIVTSTAAIAMERHRSQERLAEVLKRQGAMLDGLPARIALVYGTGLIGSVNSAWLSWLEEADLTVGQFGAGANLLETCDSVLASSACSLIRDVVEGRSGTADCECCWRDGGNPRWVRLTVAPVSGGEGTRRDVIVMHLDITDRKQAENHLLAQAMELTRANAELQQFAYIASHDLREPLRTVKSFSQLLVRKFQNVADQDAIQFLKYVTDGVTRMEDLIDDLLVYTRVIHAEREEQPQAFGISEAVAAAIRDLDSAIEESGARICVGELPVVMGDRTQMTQLFQNLIGNAIKYRGPERPLINISSEFTEGGALISVSDNGIGIASRYHETIFGLFKRLHARNVPGTGIGLALCRKIAEAHGGSVWVKSEQGRGSTFYVMLPQRAEQASPGLQ